MKVLITGIAGFIGFHLSKQLLARGDEVVGIDSINDYYDPELKYARLAELGIGQEAREWRKPTISRTYPTLRFIRLKLHDRDSIDALFGAHHFDRVVNLAAQAGVRYSIDHPYEYIDSNIVGFMNVLEGCRRTKVPHLIYASSSSIYGLNNTRPFSTHAHTDHPVSLYAATKKANELMAHSYSHLYRLPTTGLRFFTVYGPWGRPDMAYFKFAMAIMENRSIDVYNGGDMWRDFTYIDDIVDGILHVMEKGAEADPEWDASHPDPATSSAPYRVFNIGNNKPVRISDFICTLEDALGKKAEKNFLPMQPGDVYATEAEISQLEQKFSWRPKTGIVQGLDAFSRWFKNYFSME